MSNRARAGSINPEAQEAVSQIDKMLGIATGTFGMVDAANTALGGQGELPLPDTSESGIEVTVEEAFSFAQHMSQQGRKLLEKAQNSPAGGSISPEALKTLSLIDSAIASAATAEVQEFARTRVASFATATHARLAAPGGRSGSLGQRTGSTGQLRSGTVSHLRPPTDGPGERRRVATTPAGVRPKLNLTVPEAAAAPSRPAETVINPVASAAAAEDTSSI